MGNGHTDQSNQLDRLFFPEPAGSNREKTNLPDQDNFDTSHQDWGIISSEQPITPVESLSHTSPEATHSPDAAPQPESTPYTPPESTPYTSLEATPHTPPETASHTSPELTSTTSPETTTTSTPESPLNPYLPPTPGSETYGQIVNLEPPRPTKPHASDADIISQSLDSLDVGQIKISNKNGLSEAGKEAVRRVKDDLDKHGDVTKFYDDCRKLTARTLGQSFANRKGMLKILEEQKGKAA